MADNEEIKEPQPEEKLPAGPKEWFKQVGWKGNPFTFNIYPELFVGYKEQTSRVLTLLLEKHKFILLSSPTGSGKTTLLRWIEDNFNGGFDKIYLGKPPEKPGDFVAIFGDKYKAKWPLSMIKKSPKNIYQIPAFLNRKLKNKHLILMVDEIHEADIEILEWLRVLGDQVKNSSLLLAGLPVFEEKLMSNLETFRKRIVATIELPSLTKEETAEMIRRRLLSVGGSGDEFTEDLMHFIHEKSGGFPREILRLCDELVNRAIEKGGQKITRDMIEGIEEPKAEERVSMSILDSFTPMQKEIIETLSQKSLSPGQIADSFNIEKYKSRQHAVRSVNNILKLLLAEDFVERRQSEKTFVYSLTPKIKSLLVKA